MALKNLNISLQQKSGMAYPFGNSIAVVLGNKTLLESVNTSIRNILTTPRGSVPYDPTFGSMVPFLVFEPLDAASLNILAFYAREDLVRQETRLQLASIRVAVPSEEKVVVWIGFVLRNDQTQTFQQQPVTFERNQI